MTQTATETLANFYGGEHQPPVEGGMMPVTNPATGEAYASAPLSNAADVDAACQAAAEAFPGWRDATPS
ncbi:MAG: aldehyde dehydrogenase family protein, partial [Acidimicrobiia bacterium]